LLILAKFVFNLEMLLQHRERIEQKERDELFKLNYKYQVELQKCDSLKASLKETWAELGRIQEEAVTNREFNWFHLYIQRLGLEIKESEKRLEQTALEIHKQKQNVIEASKKKKTLASLRAKREKEFIYELLKQEQKEIDEIVATRFNSKDSGRSIQFKA
jgi:flagellar protein FliJ